MASIRKFKGYTLVEALVSMVIINIAILIGGWTILQVTSKVYSNDNFLAEKAVTSMLNVTLEEYRFFDETIETGSIIVIKKFEPSLICINTFSINISVTSRNGKLLINRTFILNKHFK